MSQWKWHQTELPAPTHTQEGWQSLFDYLYDSAPKENVSIRGLRRLIAYLKKNKKKLSTPTVVTINSGEVTVEWHQDHDNIIVSLLPNNDEYVQYEEYSQGKLINNKQVNIVKGNPR